MAFLKQITPGSLAKPCRIAARVVILFACCILAPSLWAEQPNIVFVYADDQASWTIGALGNRQARTPNIDRLYSEGVALRNAFTTTPVCSPSRAGLLTSRYGTEIGITDYLNSSQEPDKGLDPELPTWPKLLQGCGVCHRLRRKVARRESWTGTSRRTTDMTSSTDSGVEPASRRILRSSPAALCAIVPGFTPDVLTAEAIRFIRASAGRVPFLLSLHFWAPHANTSNRTPDGDRTWLPLSEADWNPFRNLEIALPEPDYPRLDAPRARRMLAEYLGSVASLDRNVGRLLALLDELGITSETVVIFTSDHGFNMGHNGIWHKGNGRWLLTDNRGYRSNMYDNSIRVPAVVRWPGQVPAGTAVDRVVLNLDWFPTILAMVGLDVPADAVIRGESFLPLLEGQTIPWRTSFYGEYLQLHQEQVDQRMWRTPEWKLVRDSRPGKDELYKLAEDPGEHVNLIDDTGPETATVLSRLDRELRNRMHQIASGS